MEGKEREGEKSEEEERGGEGKDAEGKGGVGEKRGWVGKWRKEWDERGICVNGL